MTRQTMALRMLGLGLIGLCGCASVHGIEDQNNVVDGSSADQSAGGAGGGTGGSAGDGAVETDAAGKGGSAGDAATEADTSTGCDGGAQSIGALDEPCCTAAELACAGHAQKLVLICDPNSHKWTALQSCSGNQLCDTTTGGKQGSCRDPVAVCIGHKPGDKVCDGLKAIECGPDLVTSVETTCQYTCEDGTCQGSCTSQDRRCSGVTPQVCTSEGAWQSEAACTYVCTGKGECTGVCAPSVKQCNGKIPQECNASGSWVDETTCAHVCSGGNCIGVCDPGSTQCSGLVPQTCNAQGSWDSAAACAYVCKSGTCTGECVPGSTDCVGLTPRNCDENGAWNSAVDCPYVCSAGVCQGKCTPGAKECWDNCPQTCDGNGAWQYGTTCSGGTPICIAGQCSTCPGSAGPVMVALQGYCIDSTEVTYAQYHAWQSATPSTNLMPSYCTSWKSSYSAGTGSGNLPVASVDWCDAYAYCKGVGKRLCGRIGGGANYYTEYHNESSSQWYNACSAGGANTYPYGIYNGQTCNGASYGLWDDTVDVGSMTGCQSSVSGYTGVYDLSGNVSEWEDSCDGTNGYYDHCHARGGSFHDDFEFLRCWDSGIEDREYRSAEIGFRCCAP